MDQKLFSRIENKYKFFQNLIIVFKFLLYFIKKNKI